MSKDITKAHPLLQEFVPKAQAWYAAKYPGRELVIGHVDRTPVEQLHLFLQDRLPADEMRKLGLPVTDAPVTWKDGFVNKSRHNMVPSHAVDLWIKVDGEFDWTKATAKSLATCIMDTGYIGRIRWGGSYNDYYHMEII